MHGASKISGMLIAQGVRMKKILIGCSTLVIWFIFSAGCGSLASPDSTATPHSVNTDLKTPPSLLPSPMAQPSPTPPPPPSPTPVPTPPLSGCGPVNGEVLFAGFGNGFNQCPALDARYEKGNLMCTASGQISVQNCIARNENAFTLRLNASRNSCTAPCGIYFEAGDTTAPVSNRLTELTYDWNFGDPAAGFINRPSYSANTASGIQAAHVYANPGQYTVTLNVRGPGGLSASQQVNINVVSADSVFTAPRGLTYCLSMDGDFTGCPTSDAAFHLNGNTTRFNRFMAEIMCNYLEPTYPQPMRLLLKAGQEFRIYNGIDRPCGRDENYLGRFGTGTDPVIWHLAVAENAADTVDRSPIIATGSSGIMTISAITFKGSYNAADGTGTFPIGIMFGGNSKNWTVYRNTFSGLATAIYPTQWVINPQDFWGYHVIADNLITNWQNFGVAGELSHSALLANKIRQNPATVHAPEDGKFDCNIVLSTCAVHFADHGPVRVWAENTRGLIAGNDMLSMDGWIGGVQPNLRVGGNFFSFLVTGNHFENTGAGAGDDTTGWNEVLWEKNTFVLGADGEAFWGTPWGDQTFRNNLMVDLPVRTPYRPQSTDGVLAKGLGLGAHGRSTGTDRRIIIEKNSLISLDHRFSDYPPAFVDVSGVNSPAGVAPYNLTLRHNLFYIPNLTRNAAWNDTRFMHYDNPAHPDTSSIDSDFNTYFNPYAAFFVGQDANSSSVNPQLTNAPLMCDGLRFHRRDITGVRATHDGVRTYLTQNGADFQAIGVRPNTPVFILQSSDGPQGLDCDYNNQGDSDYSLCGAGRAIISVSGDTITLGHDFLRTASPALDIRLFYYPSTTNVLYLEDNSAYASGDTISYNFEAVQRTVLNTGNDPVLGPYVTLSAALPQRAQGFICKWPRGAVDLRMDFRAASAVGSDLRAIEP